MVETDKKKLEIAAEFEKSVEAKSGASQRPPTPQPKSYKKSQEK